MLSPTRYECYTFKISRLVLQRKTARFFETTLSSGAVLINQTDINESSNQVGDKDSEKFFSSLVCACMCVCLCIYVSGLQARDGCIAVCCSALQCCAVSCRVLQFLAVSCSVDAGGDELTLSIVLHTLHSTCITVEDSEFLAHLNTQ